MAGDLDDAVRLQAEDNARWVRIRAGADRLAGCAPPKLVDELMAEVEALRLAYHAAMAEKLYGIRPNPEA